MSGTGANEANEANEAGEREKTKKLLRRQARASGGLRQLGRSYVVGGDGEEKRGGLHPSVHLIKRGLARVQFGHAVMNKRMAGRQRGEAGRCRCTPS